MSEGKGEKRHREEEEVRRVNRRYYQKWLKQIARKEAKGLLTAYEIEANDCYILHMDWQFSDYSDAVDSAAVALDSATVAVDSATVAVESSSSTPFQVPPIPDVADVLAWKLVDHPSQT